ncbi:peptidase U32 family protein [Desulfobacula toluolica]|uniref:Predicted peptidase, U32 family n=1 Tax=Desulfobacula toluolica (strain DSM 7467 / Tol2) TaxID=651182 RepID=K0NJR2_DESTT|nr:peptidase U32 family protein [Desulfobacula toluolica]CCK80118.1 predicted peptidase, U32 family [Desulfobacula toluolica Tol2]
MSLNTPKILAPAGDKNSFLAAIAAGADAIYCGLKMFSARMEAENFSIEELAKLTTLAKSKNILVYIAFNCIIKESEQEKVFKILCKLCRYVDFDALIVQDLAMINLANKAGLNKELHLSTLGNCTFPSGLKTANQLGFKKVVLPREFSIDEIKEMAKHTPAEDMELEMFVHGALCYSISGRCYWSSWFGGKSSLRGRCVQPCRRMYEQKGHKKRHFSCMDFSADVLVKILKQIPEITTWKIEGRKKSPHYVYYAVKAYKLLRDDPKKKKEALSFLDYAMGREFSHYNLLSQRIMNPLEHSSETASGLFAGRIQNPASPFFITREALLPSDLLRIGFEDDQFHSIQRVTRAVPKKGKFFLSKQSKFKVKKGTPVYLIDRRGAELATVIKSLDAELQDIETTSIRPVENRFKTQIVPKTVKSKNRTREITLSRGRLQQQNNTAETGVWISAQGYSSPPSPKNWLWLDPILFPGEESICSEYIAKAQKKGAKNFVLNALWQLSLFKNPKQLNLWAGPFCNITNSMTITTLKSSGFSGAIVSPELDQQTFCSLPQTSALPLGVVIYGNWPLSISRVISKDLKINQAFTSPKGETAWISKHNNNYFVFPNWYLDLTSKKEQLKKAGFSLFVNIHENIPRGIKIKNRPGLWNWDLKLL